MPGRTGRHGPGPPVSKPRYRCFYKQPVEEEKAKQAKLHASFHKALGKDPEFLTKLTVQIAELQSKIEAFKL